MSPRLFRVAKTVSGRQDCYHWLPQPTDLRVGGEARAQAIYKLRFDVCPLTGLRPVTEFAGEHRSRSGSIRTRRASRPRDAQEDGAAEVSPSSVEGGSRCVKGNDCSGACFGGNQTLRICCYKSSPSIAFIYKPIIRSNRFLSGGRVMATRRACCHIAPAFHHSRRCLSHDLHERTAGVAASPAAVVHALDGCRRRIVLAHRARHCNV